MTDTLKPRDEKDVEDAVHLRDVADGFDLDFFCVAVGFVVGLQASLLVRAREQQAAGRTSGSRRKRAIMTAGHEWYHVDVGVQIIKMR